MELLEIPSSRNDWAMTLAMSRVEILRDTSVRSAIGKVFGIEKKVKQEQREYAIFLTRYPHPGNRASTPRSCTTVSQQLESTVRHRIDYNPGH